MSREWLVGKVESEERLLATIEVLLAELRASLVVESRPVERLRLERDIERQEALAAEALGRLDGARRAFGGGVARPSAGITEHLSESAGAPSNSPRSSARSEPSVARLRVFIGHAHDDERTPSRRWLDRLLMHLRPAAAEGLIDIWLDHHIAVGQPWHDELMVELGAAHVAVLMISANFLASSYIRHHELPLLLQRHDDGELSLLPIVLEPCDVGNARYLYPDPLLGPSTRVLGSLQSVSGPERPLSTLHESDAERILLQVALRLRELAAERRDAMAR